MGCFKTLKYSCCIKTPKQGIMAFDLIRNDITFKIVVMILNISNINYIT